jgi:ABC-2 type transport system ATP-binding protein
MAIANSMIRIEKLSKRYGPTQALKELSFEVPRGQVVGFLGPNGAGKSTTMRILAGFLTPTSGKAWIGNVDVVAEPVRARRMLGYLPENNPLYEEMMVVDFLRFIAEVRKVEASVRAERIKSAVTRCGLTQVMGKDIGQLSKGYRQRVGLAAAILHEPDVLILDEPTTGLDPNQIVEIRELIKELGKEKTVILSTHVLSEVQSTCSRVLIISDGKLVADDSPEQLTTSGEGALTMVLASRSGAPLDVDKTLGVLRGVPGVTGVELSEGEGHGTAGFRVRFGAEDPRRSIFEAVVKNDLLMLEIHRTHVSLEDTFRKLTGRTESRKAA